MSAAGGTLAGVSDEPARPRTPYGDVHAAEQRARNQVPPWLAPPPPDRAPLVRLKHCWVHIDGERLPALLLDWRSSEDGWQGRVVVPVLVEDAWVPQEVWVPAAQLEET